MRVKIRNKATCFWSHGRRSGLGLEALRRERERSRVERPREPMYDSIAEAVAAHKHKRGK